MQKKVLVGAVLSAILASWFFPGLGGSQGGDQFLDGIGETALVARYVLGGNAEDSSRNNFHASLRGSGGAFVEDSRFGRALELSGNGSYVQLPGQALAGEDTISVAGWLYLPTGASGPCRRRARGAGWCCLAACPRPTPRRDSMAIVFTMVRSRCTALFPIILPCTLWRSRCWLADRRPPGC